MHIPQDDFPSDDDTRALTPHDLLAKGRLVHAKGFPKAAAKAAIAEWQELREYFLGDFYLLLPLTVSAHDWCAWQFHRADRDAGIAVFFRRHRSPFPAMRASLKRIDPQACYRITTATGYRPSRPRTLTGKALAELRIGIAAQPGSLLLRYQRLEEGQHAQG
jgi:hypothetical protein